MTTFFKTKTVHTQIKINRTLSNLDCAVLGGSSRRRQLSSRRFFRLTPSLWGLTVPPGGQNTCRWSFIPREQSPNLAMRAHLAWCNAGSGAEVWRERAPAPCWLMANGCLEVLWGLAEESYCASASGGCWGCRAAALWRAGCRRRRPGLLPRAEWSPTALGHLETEPSGRVLEPYSGFLQLLLLHSVAQPLYSFTSGACLWPVGGEPRENTEKPQRTWRTQHRLWENMRIYSNSLYNYTKTFIYIQYYPEN